LASKTPKDKGNFFTKLVLLFCLLFSRLTWYFYPLLVASTTSTATRRKSKADASSTSTTVSKDTSQPAGTKVFEPFLLWKLFSTFILTEPNLT
jgi:hypothetical protein